MTAACDIRDQGDYWACLVHDVQAVPAWPDAMTTTAAGLVCPVATDPDYRLVHQTEETA